MKISDKSRINVIEFTMLHTRLVGPSEGGTIF
jgi:hypothetical protein